MPIEDVRVRYLTFLPGARTGSAYRPFDLRLQSLLNLLKNRIFH